MLAYFRCPCRITYREKSFSIHFIKTLYVHSCTRLKQFMTEACHVAWKALISSTLASKGTLLGSSRVKDLKILRTILIRQR